MVVRVILALFVSSSVFHGRITEGRPQKEPER